MSKKIANPPVYKKQLGANSIAVWETTSEDGHVFHNATLIRSYREKNSEEWKESSTFNGLADLAHVRELARLAANFIEQRERELASEI